MNKEEAIKAIQDFIGWFKTDSRIYKALQMAIKALSQESVLDKLDVIITDALDISIDQKESQTLRWVLDMISEVRE